MKKRVVNILYILFFIASIIIETYCLLELREQLINVVLGGIVVLIAGFLFIDTLVSVYKEERDYILNELKKQREESLGEIKEEMDEMLKFEKAIYVVEKRKSN